MKEKNRNDGKLFWCEVARSSTDNSQDLYLFSCLFLGGHNWTESGKFVESFVFDNFQLKFH